MRPRSEAPERMNAHPSGICALCLFLTLACGLADEPERAG
jgi:hypothetical protein